MRGRCKCIDRVGCEVGTAVEHTYEGEGFRKDDCLRSAEKSREGLFEGVFE